MRDRCAMNKVRGAGPFDFFYQKRDRRPMLKNEVERSSVEGGKQGHRLSGTTM